MLKQRAACCALQRVSPTNRPTDHQSVSQSGSQVSQSVRRGTARLLYFFLASYAAFSFSYTFLACFAGQKERQAASTVGLVSWGTPSVWACVTWLCVHTGHCDVSASYAACWADPAARHTRGNWTAENTHAQHHVHAEKQEQQRHVPLCVPVSHLVSLLLVLLLLLVCGLGPHLTDGLCDLCDLELGVVGLDLAPHVIAEQEVGTQGTVWRVLVVVVEAAGRQGQQQ